MKTKWEFSFETKNFIFEKEHKFLGSISKAAILGGSKESEEGVEFEMSIDPDKEQKHPTAKQTGNMYITVPLDHEEGKDAIRKRLPTCSLREFHLTSEK